MFAAGVPGFNFEGRTSIHSPIGVFLSLILTIMLCGIFSLRFHTFINKSGAAIQINEIDDSWSQASRAVDINADHFQMAFKVVNYNTKKVKHDSSKVDWEVHIYEGSGNDDEIA